MENLSDFFHPFSVFILIYGLWLFLIFESLGFIVDKFLINSKNPNLTSRWLLGLGIYTFFWFLTNLFLKLSFPNVLIFNICLSIPMAFLYIKYRGFRSLPSVYKNYLIPLIIVLPIIPIVLIKSTLPPYLTDEMAYHYMWPIELKTATPWKFSSGIYHVIPKNMEAFWNSTFAVTKTYFLARLSHFLVLFTALTVASEWIKKRVGKLSSIIFLLALIYIPQDLIIQATSGYVDVAASSFVFLSILYFLEFLEKKEAQLIVTSLGFWGLALGTKYSTLSSFAIAMLLLIGWGTWTWKKNKKLITGILPKSSLIFIMSGGYWYVKNLILTGNPIYPFLFRCLPQDCVQTAGFFSGWTTAVNIKNLPTIINQIFAGSVKLEILLVTALVLLIIAYKNKLNQARILILIFFLGELLILKLTSGFLFRYFIHFQFLLILFISIQSSIGSSKTSKFLGRIFLLVLLIVAVRNVYIGTRHFYSKTFTPQIEKDFAFGKTNIYGWTETIFPRMSEVVKWCDTPNPDGSYKVITTYDPGLIWFEFEGQMRVYMTNCQYGPFYGHGQEVTQIISYLRKNNIEFYLASIEDCSKNGSVKLLGFENENQLYMRNLNNEIICNSAQILPHLYFFK